MTSIIEPLALKILATPGLSEETGIETIDARMLHFPTSEPHSLRYRKLFNQVSEELGLGIVWKRNHPSSPHPNRPDPALGEISVKRPWRYTPDELEKAIQRIQQTIEIRRQRIAKLALNQFTFIPNAATVSLQKLRPVERAFIEQVGRPLQTIAHRIFGKQSHPDFEMLLRWVEEYADPASQDHFRRTCSADLPSIRPRFTPQDWPGFRDYMSSLPWFPEGYPTYNAMWPADLTPKELAYFCNNQNFSPDHPVRSPHTVVERIPEAVASAWQTNTPPANSLGQQVEWVVAGADQKFFKVTNMAHHPRFQEDFRAAAKIIREAATITVSGERLDEPFRNYLYTVADCLETGDFTRQLQVDLALIDNPLFLLFFQTEGYWPDNIKFPMSFELGTRDKSIAEVAQGHAEQAFPTLAARVNEVAERLRLQPNGHSQLQVVVVQLVTTGGDFRAFPGDVGGHDYPKVIYPGIDTHRSVVINHGPPSPQLVALREALLAPEDVAKIITGSDLRLTLMHELGHGLFGNRLDSLTRRGLLGKAYGDLWGVLAEPLSDLTAVVAYQQLCKLGMVSRTVYEGVIAHLAARQLSAAFDPKRACTKPSFIKSPHWTGSFILLGQMFQQRGIHWEDVDNPTSRASIDYDRYAQAAENLFDQLIAFSLQGRPTPYLKFGFASIQSVPAAVVRRIIQIKKAVNPAELIDFGDKNVFFQSHTPLH